MADITEQVLESTSNKICVIAGPGCRKTTGILIPKVKQVLADGSTDPSSVLILTFSRLSAKDLRNKVKDLDRAPRAATVHSFCLSFLLSEDNHAIRARVDSILLDFERETLLSDLSLILPNANRRALRTTLNKFSAGWATQPHDEVFEKADDERAFKNAVVNWLFEYEAAMMEEIVYHAVDLAHQLPDAAFLNAPQFVFVDEFQDLNRLEQEFINCLSHKCNLLLVVGDPDQSIYSFKYAHPSGLVEFSKNSGAAQFESVISWRCPKCVIKHANDLLLQAAPDRSTLLTPAPNAIEGEVHFVRKEYQVDEFAYVLKAVAERLKGDDPAQILVLVPRRKLGQEFVEFAEVHKQESGVPNEVRFSFAAKHAFNETEQNALLQFSLLARPDSLVHRRSYLGLGDDKHFAAEFGILKDRYGSVAKTFDSASADDFPKAQRRVRRLCDKVQGLRTFLDTHATADLDAVLDLLFPEASLHVADIRTILMSLREEGDTLSSLYRKLLDYIQNLPDDDKTIRVMTLIGSKGLDANHVFILGCNAGNMPGERWSEHISDTEHRNEQRRLLYVGFTRAKKSLCVSWSRRIPFRQSKGHKTPGLRTVTHGGIRYIEVGISEFLQALRVMWE